MNAHRFFIRLTSDAEPGTGLGGDVVNELLPRDHRRQPVIPASHVKGLMRAALQEINESLPWNGSLMSRVFGSPDPRPEVEAIVRLSDAVVTDNVQARLVTRTAVEVDSGVAKDTSLRTTETLSWGLEFQGTLYTSACAGTVEDLAWRLALLAIRGIGGSRSRGCGACVIRLEHETRTPGMLLQELDQVLTREQQTTPATVNTRFQQEQTMDPPRRSLSHQTAVLRLVFRAHAPICCPDITDKTNVIKTGFSIPASAVQGVILTRLNADDPALATALFESPLFRSWPLQPCHLPLSLRDETPSDLPISIRVSLTHRMAKFSAPETDFNERHFFDEALEEPYDWRNAADGAPLKAADGVLLRWADGTRRLWKAADMPHVITAHGVHSDPESPNGRNLFTVDAMAPLVWQGLLVMPEDVAERLLESLRKNPIVAIGKSRTVQGIGDLTANKIEGVPPEWKTYTDYTVLVVQSPLQLDAPQAGDPAEEELFGIACKWARDHDLLLSEKNKTWANVGVRFGWSRHQGGRQRACQVVLPGSVIRFNEKLDEEKLKTAIQNGIGEGRERGFGAVCVHPGKATSLFPDTKPQLETKENIPFREAMKLVLRMKQAATRLPNSSQIRAVQQRLLKSGSEAARAYLDQQTKRTSPIWFTWEPIYKEMKQLLTTDKKIAGRALEVLADLILFDQGKRQ